MPTALPVTIPPELIDAMPEALLIHVPPEVASVKSAAPPKQILTGAGVIGKGAALTVTVM